MGAVPRRPLAGRVSEVAPTGLPRLTKTPSMSGCRTSRSGGSSPESAFVRDLRANCSGMCVTLLTISPHFPSFFVLSGFHRQPCFSSKLMKSLRNLRSLKRDSKSSGGDPVSVRVRPTVLHHIITSTIVMGARVREKSCIHAIIGVFAGDGTFHFAVRMAKILMLDGVSVSLSPR